MIIKAGIGNDLEDVFKKSDRIKPKLQLTAEEMDGLIERKF